jgi:hypothetical protein
MLLLLNSLLQFAQRHRSAAWMNPEKHCALRTTRSLLPDELPFTLLPFLDMRRNFGTSPRIGDLLPFLDMRRNFGTSPRIGDFIKAAKSLLSNSLYPRRIAALAA